MHTTYPHRLVAKSNGIASTAYNYNRDVRDSQFHTISEVFFLHVFEIVHRFQTSLKHLSVHGSRSH